MRVKIVELQDRHVESRHEVRWIIVSHLHDDHDRVRYQCPAAKWQPQSFMDVEFLNRCHRLAAPDRNAPTMLTGVHVDGHDTTERRLEQRSPAQPQPILTSADEIVRRLRWLRF